MKQIFKKIFVLILLAGLALVIASATTAFALTAPEVSEQAADAECSPCVVGEMMGELADKYAEEIFNIVLSGSVPLFIVLSMIWAAYIVAKLLVADGTPLELLVGIGYIMAAGVFLTDDSYWFNWIYETTIDVLVKLSRAALILTDRTPSTYRGDTATLKGALGSIIDAAYVSVRVFLDVAGAQLDQGGWTAMKVWTSGVVMMISLVIMLAMYLGQLGTAVFRIVAITAIGPLLIVAWAFKSSRSVATGAIKHMAASVLIMTIASIGMGLTGYFFEGMISILPAEPASVPGGKSNINVSALSDFAFGWKFIAIVLMAWLSIAFQWEAGTLGAGLLGVFLNSAGPAIFAAGAVFAATAPLKALRGAQQLGNDAKAVGKGVGGVVGAGKSIIQAGSKMDQYLKAFGKGGESKNA